MKFTAKRTIARAFVALLLLPASCLGAQERKNTWRCAVAPNPAMTFNLLPNSAFLTLGVPFRTNELGFRDDPVIPKTPEVFRILCLGDSVTFGSGVGNEETFPNVLERSLQNSARPGITVDAINAGVSAYNIRNVRGQAQQYIQSLQPDVVVYTFVENDLDDSVSATPEGRLAAYDPQKPADEPYIADDFPPMWLMRREDQKKKGFFGRIAGFFDNQLSEVTEAPPPLLIGDHPETRERWRTFGEELGLLRDSCAQAGSSFYVYSFAMREHSEPVVRRVRKACKDLSVRDTTTLPIFRYEDYMDEHSLGYDPHCNALGHRLMASRLQCFLMDEGVFPKSLFDLPVEHVHYEEVFDSDFADDLERSSLESPRAIDVDGGDGVLGMLGGIDPEGNMARYGLFRLAGPGDSVEVTVSPLLATPEKPQSLSAEIEGQPIGSPVRLRKLRMKVSFPVPAKYRESRVEIKLIARGPVWVPPIKDRAQGATPRTIRLHRVERVNSSE